MSSKSFLPIAFHQNEWKNFADANLSIATHALHYGTAAFGGMRAIPDPENPSEILLFRITDHAKRLANSAKFFGITPLSRGDGDSQEGFSSDIPRFSQSYFEYLIIEFVRRNQPTKPIYIRPLIYTSDLDLSPRLHDIEWDVLMYGLEMGDYLKPDGITCTVSSWQRQQDASFPLRGKISGAYITSALAKTEAVKRGFDEAILMNAHGKVSEWSAMNIFVVRNGVIKTPAVTEDILEGITRDSVIQIARELGYTVIEWQIDKSELFIADEVFFSGTAARVTPVKRIEHYDLPLVHPITDALKERFEKVVQGKDDEFGEWITRVKI